MSDKIEITGLRGTIYKRGKDSYRVQLSLGRNAEGKYNVKRETIRGSKQDAIDFLTRWNVEYLDNCIFPTSRRTVKELYKEWIEEVEIYQEYNTYRFYKEKWEVYVLEAIGHKKLEEVSLTDLQAILKQHLRQDKQLKNAMSPFFTWCVDNKWFKANPCFKLKTKSVEKEKTEAEVWDFEDVKKVYERLTFERLYDIFVVLGVELGLRPQEIMALTWDRIRDDHIVIDQAVKKRTPKEFQIGITRTHTSRRYLPLTATVTEKLNLHKEKQLKRMSKNKKYADHNLVVADKNGRVPCLRYIRRYMTQLAERSEVNAIPPKNLRTTFTSLMTAVGVPLAMIQQMVGHKIRSEVTSQHYIRTYYQSLVDTAQALHEKLHENDVN